MDPQKPIIWLAGYGNANSHETFKERVIELNALVLDVRMVPASRLPHWHGDDLRENLGMRHYAHWPWWGNPTFKQGVITLGDFPQGLRMMQSVIARNIEIETPYAGIVLLCGCRAVSQCHRGEIGKRLSALDYPVREFIWRPKR